MQNTWFVIVPPLVVVGIVLLTRRMIPAFLVGIGIGTLIATDGNILDAFILGIKRLWINTGLSTVDSWAGFWSSWNLLIFLFLIFLGIIIVILQKTGAAQAYAYVIRSYVHSKRSVEVSSLLFSLIFFIDDYFSALTVGTVMRPLAHTYGVPPIKLAFLVTAMAAPLAVLSPISSWIGEIVLQLKQVGINTQGSGLIVNADPFFIFVRAIPYMLYPILLILGTWYIVLRRISFGPMARYEKAVVTNEPNIKSDQLVPTASLFDFIVPILTLIISVFVGLLATGNFVLFGGDNDFIQALKTTAPHRALFGGGLVSLLCTVGYFALRGKLSYKNMKSYSMQGIMLMLPSILMLIHAWTLSMILKQDLQTGVYIAGIFMHIITQTLFPVLCFIMAGAIAAMVGSSWAAMGLMFPIVIPMIPIILNFPVGLTLDTVPLLLPMVIGATMSGCVFGIHLSFVSDTPIMSAASTGANHVEHVKTLMWYVIPIASAAAGAYAIQGMVGQGLGGMWIGLLSGVVLTIGILELAQLLFGKK